MSIVHPEYNVLGGGEWTAFRLAEYLTGNGATVDLYVGEGLDVARSFKLFDVDLDGVKICRVHRPGSIDMVESVDVARAGQLLYKYNTFFQHLDNDELDGTVVATQQVPDIHSAPVFDVMYCHMPFFLRDVAAKPWGYRHILQRWRGNNLAASGMYAANSRYTAERLPVDASVVPPPIQRMEYRDDWVDKGRDVVTIGRLSKVYKHRNTLFKICRMADVNLTVIGNGDATVFDDAPDFVSVVANPDRDELERVVGNARVGLVTGREAFGITLVEYAQAGVIPVAEDIAGAAEVLPYNGFLYGNVGEAVRLVRRYCHGKPTEYTVQMLDAVVHQYMGGFEAWADNTFL